MLCVHYVSFHCLHFQTALTEYWDDDGSVIDEDFPPELPSEEAMCHSQTDQLDPEQRAIIWWVVMFTSLFQTLHSLPARAIQWLLRFLFCLTTIFGKYSPKISRIAHALPATISQRSQYFKHISPVPTIVNMVVCRHCHSVFRFEECVENRRSVLTPKLCCYCLKSKIRAPLLREVVTNQQSRKLYPFRVYPTCSLFESLKSVLQRPGILEMCEEWRASFLADPGILRDSFDGKIWMDFQCPEGKAFLLNKGSICLMLNIDWFKPFKHRNYSVGVVYMVIMNLPRAQRFKRENLLLIGLISGPDEPPLTINSYLAPVVKDLLVMWQGFPLQCGQPDAVIVRCALVCIACDLPAGRKTCGFLSYTANLGCSRCYHNFGTGTFGVRNYSGFNRESWEPRTNARHRKDVNLTLQCRNKTEREKTESVVGCRYSVLLDLPYFDPVRMLIIDPMHNLYLGTAKTIFHKVWMVHLANDKTSLTEISHRVSTIIVPATVRFARIPSPVDYSLTAEQWMIWVNYYSIYCLHGILSNEEIECWRQFVFASRLLSSSSITKDNVQLADALLLSFCRRFENIYGSSSVTPNMHMHGHLTECIKDFGPLSSFWCFSFERFNGLLGDLPTNNRLIEAQIMQRFIHDNYHLQSLSYSPTDISESSEVNAMFKSVIVDHACSFHSLKYQSNATSRTESACTSGFTYLPARKYTMSSFSLSEVEALLKVYSSLYETLSTVRVEDVPQTYKKMLTLTINGEQFSSGQYVFAKSVFEFHSGLREEAHTVFTDPDYRPARIDHFAVHSISLNDTIYVHCFAVVTWPQRHPEVNYFGKPYQVWCKSLYENSLFNFAIPIENISCALLIADSVVQEENVLLVVPLIS